MSRSSKDAKRRAKVSGTNYMRARLENNRPPRGYSNPSDRNSARDQRGLEFAVFYQLVDEFNAHYTRPGTALGLENVYIRDGYPILVPAENYSDRILSRLLPSYDRESGNHYGIAGLRARRFDDEWELRVRNTDAKVHIPAARFSEHILNGEWNSVPDRIELFWKTHEHYVSDEELNRWWFNQRDIPEANTALTSTLLRQPAVVQRLNASGTCWVDIYHHAYRDVMLEWCCGPTKTAVIQWIEAESAIEMWLNRPSPDPHPDAVIASKRTHPLVLSRHECGEERHSWTGDSSKGHLMSLVEDYEEEIA